MWVVLGVGAVAVVVTGWLPSSVAYDVAVTRGAPVLGFLVAITVLSELADAAGVFDTAASLCARAARGSTWRLYLLVAALATATTVGMSLDTTAVLLTPVVLTIADSLGLAMLPFALLVVWLANTASLLLPVSNLTNLLALQQAQLPTLSFAARMALPELAAVVVTVAYLGWRFRRDLTGHYQLPRVAAIGDRWTFWVTAASCLALAPAVIAGVTPWVAAAPAAFAAVVVFGARDRRGLGWRLVPWRIVILTEGLFLVVSAVARHGGSHLLGQLAGESSWRTTAVAGVASNLVNNLPAYLAIEPVVPHGHPTRLLAALVGTNAGPLILLWGSLATLLWRERCKARRVQISARTFAATGLVGVPLVLAASWVALTITA